VGVEEGVEYKKIKMDLKIQRDARFANFVNEFTGYIDPFRTKQLYDPLREMGPELREKNRTQIGVIKELEPRLTDIEVYSGWERKKIEDGRLEERGVNVTMRDRVSTKYLARKTRNLVNRYTPSGVKGAVERVRKAISTVWPQIHRDHAMRREYARRLSDREVVRQHVRNVSALPLKALARFEYFMVGVESVADTIEERSTSDSQE
jgi:hypothetical protein